MADILPKSLDKDTDWDKWDEFLLNVDKDKIIDFLIVEEMESIDHILTAEINDNKDAISDDERKEIIAFIKSSQQEYRISLMEDNEYLENIKKLFD